MNRYLGSDPDAVVAQLRSRAPEWFAQAEEIAEYASSLLLRLDVHDGNLQELLASLLLQRVTAGFEAALLLAERGMHTQGLVQRRSVLEALFVLGAIVEDAEYVDKFIAADEARLFGIHKKIMRLPSTIREALEPEISLASIEAKITESKGKKGPPNGPSAADYAKAAGLETHYLTDYSLASEAAHSVAKDLERHIHLNDEGEIDGLSWGPEDVPVPNLLAQTMDYVLMACFAVERLFLGSPTIELNRLRVRVNGLIEQSVLAG